MGVGKLREKTLLLTGATGFIGRHVALELLRTQASRLLLLARHRGSLGLGDDPRVSWIECPLEEVGPELWQQLGATRIDVVFHLGAFIPKNASEVNEVASIYSANLCGTRALLDSLPNVPDRIVFASSVDVYKPGGTSVIDEDSPLGPAGLYGASKIFCEKLVEAYAQRSGGGYSILRYGHVYGPGEEAFAKLIPQTIRALLAGKAPTVHGDGTALRDFLYVSDVVEATVRAALVDTSALGPVNVVSGRSYPIREIVELVRSLAGSASEIEYLRDRPNGHSLRFDNNRMLEALGRWELVPLATGLQLEVEHFRSLG